MGVNSDLLEIATRMVRAFSGDNREFPTAEEACAALGMIVQNKQVLLVVEDVIEPRNAQMLFRAATACGRILTTRDMAVVHSLGARQFTVNGLEEGEAVQLLTEGLEERFRPDGDRVRRIARLLECQPLALKLATSIAICISCSWKSGTPRVFLRAGSKSGCR